MHCINNLEVYNKGMAKSLEDKLFFLKQLPMSKIDSVLDYGCGDGTVLCAISERYTHINCVGYDNNPDMCGYQNYEEALEQCIGTKLLVLSSVIHEVYSYGEADSFWQQIFSSGFNYIAVRDMSYDKITLQKWAESIDPKMVAQHPLWNDYVSKHNGRITALELQEFFMKYRYVENWERESVENYLPLEARELKHMFESNGYEVEYFKAYCLEFLKNRVLTDFGVKMPDVTHVNLIAKLR